MKQSPISAESIWAPIGKTIYPEPLASLVKGRQKRKLGEYFGLTHFGVNLTHLYTRCNFCPCSQPLKARRIYPGIRRQPNTGTRRRGIYFTGRGLLWI